MAPPLRSLARRVLRPKREATYYLPWLSVTASECVVLLSNIEARFNRDFNRGPFPITVSQHDADGSVARRYRTVLPTATDTVELSIQATPAGYGVLTVVSDRTYSGSHVSLSDGHGYTTTHGRKEFVEHYPWLARVTLGAVGTIFGSLGRTVPAFRRVQHLYVGPDTASHLLVMNLSNITNRVLATARREGEAPRRRLLRLPPLGSALLTPDGFLPPSASSIVFWNVTLQGNAWFNLYVVGTGARGLAGPASLQHVK
jgi:hypothetical protein